MRICLGCNRSMKSVGFMSVDLDGSPDIRDDVFELRSVEDNSCERIVASHVLEHGPYKGMADERVGQVIDVLKLWRSKLSNNGKIYIAVPNFDVIATRYMNHKYRFWEIFDIVGPLLGGGSNDYDQHRMIFNEPLLEHVLSKYGFIHICKMSLGAYEFLPDFNGASMDPRGFNMMGIKK